MTHVIQSENVQKLVAKQGRLWDLKKQSAKQLWRNGRGMAGRIAFGPYLLISREMGAGGLVVAERVGRKLNWPVFDREIVDVISREANVREQLVESVDEHVRGSLEDFIRDVLMPRGLGTDSYLMNLRRVVLMLGHQGDVVIVGRGAEQILPGPFGLRVRLVAPLEERIQRVQERKGISRDDALETIQSADRERGEFLRRQFGRDAKDPLNYDLVLNTGGMEMDRVVLMVLSALQRKLGVRFDED